MRCYKVANQADTGATSGATDLARLADRVGATASLLCAVHCAVLPFVLAVLPALSLSFLADHRFERVFIACASGLAALPPPCCSSDIKSTVVHAL